MTADTAHHAAGAAPAHGGGHGDIPEIPNIVTLLKDVAHDHPLVAWLHHWENLLFSLIVAGVLCAIAWRYARRPTLIPGGGQNVLELLVDGVDKFVQSILGPGGRQHVPFIGTLFLYIWLMNLSGLIPGMKSSTANLNTTAGLAIVVFFYVEWIGIRSQGVLKFLDHMAGSPRDLVGWLMVPLMLPIHVLGELIRPLSLSLRLGFNVFAEDVLLAVLLGLGLAAGFAVPLPSGEFRIGVPLQFLVVPLVLIFSTVQALVFSLLSTVYIALLSPHGDHGAHHEATGPANRRGHA